MISHRIALAALAISVACFPTPPSANRDESRVLRTEIEAINRQMEAALARGDMLAVASFYADDARLVGPRGQEVRGRANIDAYWRQIRNAKAWQLEAFAIGGSATEAYEFGRSTLVQALSTGDRTSVTDFVVVWKREQNGRMRIALDFYH